MDSRGDTAVYTFDSTTRATLFDRLRSPENAAAWREFERLYADMLFRFARSIGLQHADAEDVVQTVFARFMASIERFEYDRSRGRFRDYLFRCTKNALADLKSSQNRALASVVLSDNSDTDLKQQFEQEWIRHHYRHAINHLSTHMNPRDRAIFEDALIKRPIREIAAEHAMTETAVYKVLQRTRDRLRERIALQVRQEDGQP